jgi:hypothetical protein
MSGHLCPPCFFRRAYQTVTSPSQFRCHLCSTNNENKVCRKCSQRKGICRDCGNLIRDGSSYSQQLETIKFHLEDLIREEKYYQAILDNLCARQRLYSISDRDDMLKLTRL